MASARLHGTDPSRLRAVLVERGLMRSKSDDYAARAKKMSRDVLALPVEEIVTRFQAGESTNALAKSYGVARHAIDRRLRAAGIEPRGQVDANRLSFSTRSPDEIRRNIAAAQDAVRGVKRSPEEMIRRAQVRERSPRWIADHTSALEMQFGRWLDERGVSYVPQKAVGPYNIDFACGAVAVEINGGAWHGYGEHRERAPERYRHILTAGWNLVIVWAGARRIPLTSASADAVVEFIRDADPLLRGQHRVIWGDGVEVPSDGFDLEALADLPDRRR